MTAVIVIPFRDRGRDPLRRQNLDRVRAHWTSSPWDHVVADDGRDGDQQFNRSAAYNRGAELTGADILVYSESDLIVDYTQIQQAIDQAASAPGLVVAFSRFMALTPEASETIRKPACCGNAFCTFERHSPTESDAVQVRGERKSIGAVNVISRATLNLIGQWDETFEGSWYDDDSMARAFEVCCGPTRFVDGPGYHLHHLPGATGDHLTDADRAATEANKARYQQYLAAETPEQIRTLTAGG